YCVTDSMAGSRRSIGAPDSNTTSTLAAAPAGAAWIGTASRGAGGSSPASGKDGSAYGATTVAVAPDVGVSVGEAARGLMGLTRSGASGADRPPGPLGPLGA